MVRLLHSVLLSCAIVGAALCTLSAIVLWACLLHPGGMPTDIGRTMTQGMLMFGAGTLGVLIMGRAQLTSQVTW